jgi:hypothetical protein
MVAATWPPAQCLGHLEGEGRVTEVQKGKYTLMYAMEAYTRTFLSLAICKVSGQLYVPSALTPECSHILTECKAEHLPVTV